MLLSGAEPVEDGFDWRWCRFNFWFQTPEFSEQRMTSPKLTTCFDVRALGVLHKRRNLLATLGAPGDVAILPDGRFRE